ncbi:MAG TPA: DUF2314 domain-containing protein [Anaerolineales bacterium]|nr:DUF2314 domain-containing protein [Anaerolineales bacterium]
MYKPLQWKSFILLVFVILASCSPAEPTATSISTPGPITFHTQIPALADEELAEAIRQAQETLPLWRQEFLAPKKAYSITSLKVRFGEEGVIEDMWTEPLYVLDNLYTVRMIEGVTVEQGIHPDRLVDVRPEDIIDWMLLEEDGTLSGGYTLRLEYKRMTPEQQKRYIETTGIRFDKAE